MKRRMRRKLQERGRGATVPAPVKRDALSLGVAERERRVKQRSWNGDTYQQDMDTLGWISQPTKQRTQT